jgi:uncharacterized protein DUF2452
VKLTKPQDVTPNPQGKGLVTVLDSLLLARKTVSVPAKNMDQIANELFTSLFVLNSQIKFKPVIGRRYWLYRKNRTYQLSLIAPEQWTPSKYGCYIGACELQKDITWTLRLSSQSQNDRQLLSAIAIQRASALAHSLEQSMHKAGISGLNFNQVRQIESSTTNFK